MVRTLKPFDDVFLLTSSRFDDSRGFFCETWHLDKFEAEIGRRVNFVQDCFSMSRDLYTLRGLHGQAPPNAQEKLVRVGKGRVIDTIVDIRIGSPTYGKWASVELSSDNGEQLFVTAGFLHGFVTLEEGTEVHYKISGNYSPRDALTVRFDDPTLGIDLGVDLSACARSEADAQGQLFADFKSPFVYPVPRSSVS